MSDKIEKAKGKKTLTKDERGLSTVEYIIILVLIAVACITLWQGFGDVLVEKIGSSTDAVESI